MKPEKPRQTKLKTRSSSAPVLAPQLLPPMLMTGDMLVQQEMALESMSCPTERAEFVAGRELRADMSAFKKANPGAQFEDFIEWYISEVPGFRDRWPADWQRQCWEEALSRHAAEQRPLFEPEREAEMALHYLENIDGGQLLLEIFRVALDDSTEELTDSSEASRVLRAKLDACVAAAFPAKVGHSRREPVGVFPCDEQFLQDILQAFEELESSVRLAASLRQKLAGFDDSMLKDLITDGEMIVTTEAHRRCVEDCFNKSRGAAEAELFAELPFSKEFIFLPADTDNSCGAIVSRRMYAEVRENHLRLATTHCLSVS